MKLLPGTMIETGALAEGESRRIFENVFSCGGLMLSQVCNMTGLESHTVQNWVKRRYVSSPKGRMYDVDQFSRLVIINMLKDSLQLDSIERLLSYINGHLDDRSDDLITDSELYHMFVSILIGLEGESGTERMWELAQKVAGEYKEPLPGARNRLVKVLVIMTQSYYSAEMKRRAELMMGELD